MPRRGMSTMHPLYRALEIPGHLCGIGGPFFTPDRETRVLWGPDYVPPSEGAVEQVTVNTQGSRMAWVQHHFVSRL